MEEILKQILNEMQDMKLEMKDMKTQIFENTQMLKSIHHSVEVQKAGQQGNQPRGRFLDGSCGFAERSKSFFTPKQVNVDTTYDTVI